MNCYGLALVILLSPVAHVSLGCTRTTQTPDSSSESDQKILVKVRVPPPPAPIIKNKIVVPAPATVSIIPITSRNMKDHISSFTEHLKLRLGLTTAPTTTKMLPCEPECVTTASLLLTSPNPETPPVFKPLLATLNCDGAGVARAGDKFTAFCTDMNAPILQVQVGDVGGNDFDIPENFGFTCVKNVGWVYNGPNSYLIGPGFGNTLECNPAP